MAKCPDCYDIVIASFPERGNGKCRVCRGTGIGGLLDEFVDANNPFGRGFIECYSCHGTKQCQTCGGTGVVQAKGGREGPSENEPPIDDPKPKVNDEDKRRGSLPDTSGATTSGSSVASNALWRFLAVMYSGLVLLFWVWSFRLLFRYPYPPPPKVMEEIVGTLGQLWSPTVDPVLNFLIDVVIAVVGVFLAIGIVVSGLVLIGVALIVTLVAIGVQGLIVLGNTSPTGAVVAVGISAWLLYVCVRRLARRFR